MGNIRRLYDSGIRGTETTAFIQCINGRDPQINELWCQYLDRICREVNTTSFVDIPAGTSGEFVTDYLAENGRQIRIIGELTIKGSIQFLVLYDQVWVIGLLYISNLWSQVEATGWVSSNNSNLIWGVNSNDANSINNVA